MAAWTRLALWKRYVLTLAVAAALMIALVRFVDAHNTDSPREQNFAAEVRANREAEVLVAQDQAPRVLIAAHSRSPRAAMILAVRRDMSRRIASGAIGGSIQRVRCHPVDRGGAFSCVVTAGGIEYPYLGVVDERAHRVTYCKRDPPPAPADDVPVSPRCTTPTSGS